MDSMCMIKLEFNLSTLNLRVFDCSKVALVVLPCITVVIQNSLTLFTQLLGSKLVHRNLHLSNCVSQKLRVLKIQFFERHVKLRISYSSVL